MLASTLFLGTLGCGSDAPDSPELDDVGTTALATSTGDTSFLVKPSSVAGSTYKVPSETSVQLSNGNKINFHQLRDAKVGPLGYMVTESVKAGNVGVVAAVPELRAANPLVLFHALTEPKTRIPAGLIEAYGPLVSRDAQGWALIPASAPSNGPYSGYIDCSANTSWNDFLNQWYGAGDTFSFHSKDDGPNLKPDHWLDKVGYFGSGYSELTGVAYNTSEFMARVRVCLLDEEYEGQWNTGSSKPVFRISYRANGANYWYTLGGLETAQSDADEDYYYEIGFLWANCLGDCGQFIEGTNLDWKLEIDWGFNNDNYWIHANWRNPETTYTP